MDKEGESTHREGTKQGYKHCRETKCGHRDCAHNDIQFRVMVLSGRGNSQGRVSHTRMFARTETCQIAHGVEMWRHVSEKVSCGRSNSTFLGLFEVCAHAFMNAHHHHHIIRYSRGEYFSSYRQSHMGSHRLEPMQAHHYTQALHAYTHKHTTRAPQFHVHVNQDTCSCSPAPQYIPSVTPRLLLSTHKIHTNTYSHPPQINHT